MQGRVWVFPVAFCPVLLGRDCVRHSGGGWGWGGECFFTHHHRRLLPLSPQLCLRGCLAAASIACAYLALLSMMLIILGPIWISAISLPVACFASSMYRVLFCRGPVL